MNCVPVSSLQVIVSPPAIASVKVLGPSATLQVVLIGNREPKPGWHPVGPTHLQIAPPMTTCGPAYAVCAPQTIDAIPAPRST